MRDGGSAVGQERGRELNLITFEGRTVAVLAPEDLEALEAERDTLKQENATLKRQAEVIVAASRGMLEAWRNKSSLAWQPESNPELLEKLRSALLSFDEAKKGGGKRDTMKSKKLSDCTRCL
jgi:hypothetical protein